MAESQQFPLLYINLDWSRTSSTLKILYHSSSICKGLFTKKENLDNLVFYGWGVGGLPPTPLTKKNPLSGIFRLT